MKHPVRYTAQYRAARTGGRFQHGAAIVELTVVLVFFFVPLLLLIVEFGRLVQTYKTLVHQAHHTARYLSVQLPGQRHDRARCLFLSGEAVDGCDSTAYLLPGLADSDFVLEIADASQGGAQQNWAVGPATGARKMNLVTVSASGYPYAFTFSDLLGLPALPLPTVTATYRQVH